VLIGIGYSAPCFPREFPQIKKILAIPRRIANNLNTNCSHLHKGMLMIRSAPPRIADTSTPAKPGVNTSPVPRIKSQDLFQNMREVEIDHQGRIYKLRLTQLNKLILTA
jgi:hemin uptake protein HemP